MGGSTEEGCGLTIGEQELVIRFGTYHICHGRNGGLESLLRGMDLGNIDLGVFQEIKVTDGFHTCASKNYRVFATNTPIQHSVGVLLLYRYDASHLKVETMQQHGLNALSFQVTPRGRWWFIFGFYIAPDNVVPSIALSLPSSSTPVGLH